jgi:hypothetical protein
MPWNALHVNEIDYPDNPELQQALDNFRQQYSWYESQLKCNRYSIDLTVVQTAWDNYLRLRNRYDYNRRSSNPSALKGSRSR